MAWLSWIRHTIGQCMNAWVSPASGANDDRVTCRFQEVEESEETFTWQPPRTELGISKFGQKFEARLPKIGSIRSGMNSTDLNSRWKRSLKLGRTKMLIHQKATACNCKMVHMVLLSWSSRNANKKLRTFRSPAPLNPLKIQAYKKPGATRSILDEIWSGCRWASAHTYAHYIDRCQYEDATRSDPQTKMAQILAMQNQRAG